MGDPELRPEVLDVLTRQAGLTSEQGDVLLDATPAERAAASHLLLEQCRDILQQVGVIPPTRSVLDLRHGQLAILAAVYGLTAAWWNQPGWRDRSLGDLLKVAPRERAEVVMQLLRWGGFLPPEVPPEAAGE